MNTAELAEAFGEKPADDAEPADLDAEDPETGDTNEKAITADADVFFDDTEDRETRLEALRRLVRKLK